MKIQKPACLGIEFAEQFQDPAVAAAYWARPPYPAEVFATLNSLQRHRPGKVLELGCGTGDLTIGLADFVEYIDAVEPSDAMLQVAHSRPGADSPRIKWHRCSAEDFAYSEPYDLVVAAESLHWMDLDIVVPKLFDVLEPEAFLAIVGRRYVLPPQVRQALDSLIPRYSTNRNYESYDVVDILRQSGCLEEVGRLKCAEDHTLSVDDLIESLHSRNGLSRDRMTTGDAADFDEQVRAAAAPLASQAPLLVQTTGTVVWGHLVDRVMSDNA